MDSDAMSTCGAETDYLRQYPDGVTTDSNDPQLLRRELAQTTRERDAARLEAFELRGEVEQLRLELKQVVTAAEKTWREERAERLRMAEVALSYGSHLAGCIHEQSNDCDCGLWRELGMR